MNTFAKREIFLSSLCLLLSSVVVWAESGQSVDDSKFGRKGAGSRLIEQLDLTDQQRVEMRKMMGETRAPNQQPPAQEMREHLMRLMDLASEGADDAEIDKELALLGVGIKRKAERARRMQKILTPEQQAKLKQLKTEKRGEMREHFKNRKGEFSEDKPSDH